MILVPYFWNTTNPNWTTLGLFLSNGGREAWTLDGTETDGDITDMLLENGFPVAGLIRTKNAVYASVDENRIKMAHFYQWSEMNPTSEDVWRIFQIPTALWSCPVFKDHYWKAAALPFDGSLVPAS